ncbi:MAG: MerR family transcriptional regulator [Sulfurovum sp.]|nr:MerR family transcriptional regulator [Sulfurovum sp.]
MEYKISELVAKSGIPKSTILYYIREGLLPEAKKLKSNVHRYSDEHLELIKYIKYMKEHLGSSNEQIKYALQHRNQSLATSSTMIEPLMNTLSTITPDMPHYTKKNFISHFNIDASLLEKLLSDEIVVPLGEDDYTEREATMVRLVEHYLEVGIDYGILKSYVFHAKALAQLENMMQTQLCAVRNEKNFSTLWQIMFETLFNAKEYLFKRHTYRIFFNTLKEELSRNTK